MCVAYPSYTNPIHLAQLLNTLLLPSVPLLLSAAEIRGVQVRLLSTRRSVLAPCGGPHRTIERRCQDKFLNWPHPPFTQLPLSPLSPLRTPPPSNTDSQDTRHFMEQETGYQKIQGTKPQTLAYGLHDSPVGLAAWILEKFKV